MAINLIAVSLADKEADKTTEILDASCQMLVARF